MNDVGEALSIYTIGHSTRSIEEFVDLLRTGGVRHVVDVRTIPRSRTNPQYNSETLAESLDAFQIAYSLISELGGRRASAKDVSSDINGWWQNQSFHNYADYALTTPFRDGLDQLIVLAQEAPTAVMCAEAVWWRCHRRIIADYLLAEDHNVCHLMGKDRIETAKLTDGAVVDGGSVHYPAH